MTSHEAERAEPGPITVLEHFSYRIVWTGSTAFEVFYLNVELPVSFVYDGPGKMDFEHAQNRAEDWWASGGREKAERAHRQEVLSERS